MTSQEVVRMLEHMIYYRRLDRPHHPEQYLTVLNNHGDELSLVLFDGTEPAQFFRVEVYEDERARVV